MITFTARLRIMPGKEEAALARARAMVQSVRDKEPGVLAYIGHQSQDHPQELVFYEVYADQAARDAHDKTPHFAELIKELGTVFDADYGAKIEMLDRIDGVVRT